MLCVYRYVAKEDFATLRSHFGSSERWHSFWLAMRDFLGGSPFEQVNLYDGSGRDCAFDVQNNAYMLWTGGLLPPTVGLPPPRGVLSHPGLHKKQLRQQARCVPGTILTGPTLHKSGSFGFLRVRCGVAPFWFQTRPKSIPIRPKQSQEDNRKSQEDVATSTGLQPRPAVTKRL
jgi:hypothetical protein